VCVCVCVCEEKKEADESAGQVQMGGRETEVKRQTGGTKCETSEVGENKKRRRKVM